MPSAIPIFIRFTKKGTKSLTDPRDIYEHTANFAARRLRACILGVIPQDIIDEAQDACEATLKSGDGVPLEDRIRKMLVAFDGVGVTKELIEKRIGHNSESINATELVGLQKIFISLRDGMSKRGDWFDFGKESSEE